MGSVLDTVACPRCGGEAFFEFYYNTGEEETSCSHCGYSCERRYQRDENRKLVTKDGTDNYAFDNLIWTVQEVKPFAVFNLKLKEVLMTQCGSLEDEAAVADFKAEVERRKDEIERAVVGWYDEERKYMVVIDFLSTAK